MKKKEIVISVIFLIYIVLSCSYIYFSDGKLNKILSTKFGFAQLYSFSTLIGFIVIVFSILMILISIFRNSFKLKIDVSNIILMFTIVFSLSFVFLGMDNKKIEEQHIDKRTIKLVEWNVADNINEKNIQDIFGEFDADIAVFPELEGYEKGDKTNRRLVDLFEKANVDFKKYEVYISEPTEGSIAPVTVVIKKTFGNYNIYKETPMTRFGTVYLSSTSKNNPPIIGVHTAPPLPGLMSMWKRDLDLIADISKNNPDSIIIGDFNATMKHGSLNEIRRHIDVLEYAPKFNSGTWNINIPSIFRTRIDHILIPNNKYGVKNVEIKKYTNSDHLCVFAEIQEHKSHKRYREEVEQAEKVNTCIERLQE